MILHFSHIGLTDGRTFTISALYSDCNSSRSPALETVSAAATELQRHPVARLEPRAGATGDVSRGALMCRRWVLGPAFGCHPWGRAAGHPCPAGGRVHAARHGGRAEPALAATATLGIRASQAPPAAPHPTDAERSEAQELCGGRATALGLVPGRQDPRPGRGDRDRELE